MTQIDYLSVQQPLPFKSQRGGMIAFGVIFCIIGLFCLLGALTLPLAMLFMASAATTQPTLSWLMVIPMVVVYLVIAAFFILLGIDNFRAKRWVRPISIVCSAMGFLGGLLGVISVAAQWPMMRQLSQSGGTTTTSQPGALIGLIVGLGFAIVFYLVLPALIWWFYRRESVRETVYYFDRSSSWTDGVPLRVIAAGIAMLAFAMGALFLVIRSEVPMFTVMLTRQAVLIAVLPVFVVELFGAILLFRQKKSGWWIALILPLIHMIGQIVGVHKFGVASAYTGMNISPAQQQIIQSSSMQTPAAMTITMSVVMVVWVLFLFYVKPKLTEMPASHAGEMIPS